MTYLRPSCGRGDVSGRRGETPVVFKNYGKRGGMVRTRFGYGTYPQRILWSVLASLSQFLAIKLRIRLRVIGRAEFNGQSCPLNGVRRAGRNKRTANAYRVISIVYDEYNPRAERISTKLSSKIMPTETETIDLKGVSAILRRKSWKLSNGIGDLSSTINQKRFPALRLEK